MKPSEVARILEIAPTTVRAWSTEFSDMLSAGGAGGDGRFRDFTDDDLRILYFIQQEKRSSVPAAEIHESLRQMQARDFVGLPYVPERPSVARVPMIPAAAAESALDAERRALLREVAFLNEHIDKLEQQLVAERADKEKLLRELGDMHGQLSEARTELKLFRSGRLKPDNSPE
jgi:DNA-binding transcriptional MerR regulator